MIYLCKVKVNNHHGPLVIEPRPHGLLIKPECETSTYNECFVIFFPVTDARLLFGLYLCHTLRLLIGRIRNHLAATPLRVFFISAGE